MIKKALKQKKTLTRHGETRMGPRFNKKRKSSLCLRKRSLISRKGPSKKSSIISLALEKQDRKSKKEVTMGSKFGPSIPSKEIISRCKQLRSSEDLDWSYGKLMSKENNSGQPLNSKSGREAKSGKEAKSGRWELNSQMFSNAHSRGPIQEEMMSEDESLVSISLLTPSKFSRSKFGPRYGKRMSNFVVTDQLSGFGNNHNEAIPVQETGDSYTYKMEEEKNFESVRVFEGVKNKFLEISSCRAHRSERVDYLSAKRWKTEFEF